MQMSPHEKFMAFAIEQAVIAKTKGDWPFGVELFHCLCAADKFTYNSMCLFFDLRSKLSFVSNT